MYLFVYGTLKRGFGNHGLLRNSEYAGSGRISGKANTRYEMYSVGGFPAVVERDGWADTCIEGELFSIPDDETWAMLDRLEGVPHMYRRELVTVYTGIGDEVRAYAYIWNQSVDGLKLIEDGVWR